MEATKNIHCAKGEDTVDHSTVTRWTKTVDSEVVLQAIETNSESIG